MAKKVTTATLTERMRLLSLRRASSQRHRPCPTCGGVQIVCPNCVALLCIECTKGQCPRCTVNSTTLNRAGHPKVEPKILTYDRRTHHDRRKAVRKPTVVPAMLKDWLLDIEQDYFRPEMIIKVPRMTRETWDVRLLIDKRVSTPLINPETMAKKLEDYELHSIATTVNQGFSRLDSLMLLRVVRIEPAVQASLESEEDRAIKKGFE